MSDENTPTGERLQADKALRERLSPEGMIIKLLTEIRDLLTPKETPVEVKPVAAKRKKVRTPHGGGAGA